LDYKIREIKTHGCLVLAGIKGQEQKEFPSKSALWLIHLLSLHTVEEKLSGEAEGA